MAPPTPGRHRGPRPQVNNNIGEAGRTTNIAPPKGVPRDSAGHEQVEAFFDSRKYERDHGGASDDEQQDAGDYYADRADAADQSTHRPAPRRKSEQVNRRTQYDDQDSEEEEEDFGDQVRRSNQARKPQQQPSARKRQSVAQTGRTPTGARERGAERPDRYMVGDDRGRKTGITKPVVQRDEDGMEDLDAYFASPEGGRSIATTTAGARSTIKKASRNNYAAERDEEQSAAYYEQEDDMQDDDGISPLTYQRQHPSTGRAPSALRHSTTAAGERSVSRKGLSSPQANGVGSSASKFRGTRRRLSSVENDAEQQEEYGDEDEHYDQQQAYNDDEEEDEDDEEEEEEVRAALGAKPASTDASPAKKPRKSVASNRRVSDDYQRDASLEMEDSPSGLMKLDRNGRPVPADRPKNKGKGRASDYGGSPARRETFVREEVEEQYVEQDQYYPDEFGGEGYGEDPYDEHAYGDGGAGEDDYDSADGQAGHDDVDVREVDDAGNVISDEDDDEDQQMQGPSSKPYKGKGKGKGKARERPSSHRRSSESQSVSPQRGATSSKQARRRPQNQSQQQIVTEISRKRTREAGTVDIDGVRRSSREKVPRLEYWRNERIIYERRRSGVGLKAIVRVPKEDPVPLTKAGHRKGHHGVKRSTSARAPSRGKSVKAEVPEEQGCDDMTDPDGLVWSWEGEAETTRRIAFTEKMMDPKLTMDGKFAYQKIYQELDYLASGILTIPPGGEKGLKSSKDNSYVFCVLQGSVSVTVHRTRFSIGPGGTFFIPRGNMYCIVATSNREVRLFFAQGRRVIEYADGETRPDTREDSMRFIENEELQAVPEEDEEDEDGQ